MSTHGGPERRRAPRHASSKPLAIMVDSERTKISDSAFAVDLSDLGARVRSSLHLEPGQLITVIPSDGPAEGIPSQVIWVDRSGGSSEAGIAFLAPIAALGVH